MSIFDAFVLTCLCMAIIYSMIGVHKTMGLLHKLETLSRIRLNSIDESVFLVDKRLQRIEEAVAMFIKQSDLVAKALEKEDL